MAISKCSFNTETLCIFNMLDQGETIDYDWSINTDYSVVVMEGSVQFQNSTTVNYVNEYRIQPNENLTATAISPGRSYFISLFRIDVESIANQIINEASKNKTRTFVPTWYEYGAPDFSENLDISWKDEFVSGDYTLTKTLIDSQILSGDWS